MQIELNSGWRIACDPGNRGREEKWFASVPTATEPAVVPGIIQQIFPGYHGVAWFWCRCSLPSMPLPAGCWLLRFGAVDYLAEVWLNGQAVGSHEGGETPFELDVTEAALAGDNLVAVRVINPGNERIDGLVLDEIPHRNRIVPMRPGCSYNSGGILRPVCFAAVPPVRITDVFARPDSLSGQVGITISVRNDTGRSVSGQLEAAIYPQLSGERLAMAELAITFPAGDTFFELTAMISQPKIWSVDDPNLYRLSAQLTAGVHRHNRTIRFGFRDFRVTDGWFLLNGKRLFLKSSHTGNHFPITQNVPPTADLMRRDLVYAKACGFNCVRFIAGVAWPEQLDICDEIGLMVYEECLAAWWGNCEMPSAEHILQRFDNSVREMVLRDRNHPSLTIWGLLNETWDGPVFRRAVAALEWVRKLDPTRLILLGSGRWDCQPSIGSVANPGSLAWEHVWGMEAPGAPPVSTAWNKLAGGYFENAGDAHMYPGVPLTETSKNMIRSLGQGTRPVFLSEYGIGSLMDVIGEARKFEELQCHKDIHDFAVLAETGRKLAADWQRWGFEGTYPFVDDLLRESQRLHMRQRRLGFDLIRSNPRLCGYNMTGLLDHGLTGEGVWTFWRELKPLAADTLRDGWAPLRWCLFVTPEHGYAGRTQTIEAVLANEDVLPPGEYPVTFRITGLHGIVWEQSAVLTLPEASGGERPPLAVLALKAEIRLDEIGEYTFAARLERGGAPAGDRTAFRISQMPTAVPADTQRALTTWGLPQKAETWLNKAGHRLRPFSARPAKNPETILVGRPETGTRIDWLSLASRIIHGSTAVFLNPEAFRLGDQSTYWLPLAEKGACYCASDWLYHQENVARHHEVFAGLQAGGILNWDIFGPVISHALYTGLTDPDETACASFAPCCGDSADPYYKAGIMVGFYRLGAGWFVLNTLDILDQVDRHPAADRLLLNLIHAARIRRQPQYVQMPHDLVVQILGQLYPKEE